MVLDTLAKEGFYPSEDFHGFAVNATARLGSGPDDSNSRRVGFVWDGYSYRILLKAPRGKERKNEMQGCTWTYGAAGASYASSYGFAAALDRETGEIKGSGLHVKGIENDSVKAYIKRALKRREGPCNEYHPHGVCPREIFSCLFDRRAPPPLGA